MHANLTSTVTKFIETNHSIMTSIYNSHSFKNRLSRVNTANSHHTWALLKSHGLDQVHTTWLIGWVMSRSFQILKS